MASTVLAVVGFLMVLREAYRGTISLRTVTVLAVAYHVAVFLLPLLFSRDVYSYAFYGRIVGIYHQNPYVHTPVEFAGDSLWPLVGPKWVDTPAVYGPLFTSLSGGIARVATSPSSQVTAYRLLTVLASLATLAMIAGDGRAGAARRASRSPRRRTGSTRWCCSWRWAAVTTTCSSPCRSSARWRCSRRDERCGRWPCSPWARS